MQSAIPLYPSAPLSTRTSGAGAARLTTVWLVARRASGDADCELGTMVVGRDRTGARAARRRS